ncbi:MAG: hypothetical protein V1676_02590 [Candidatus Diapherotrites archaeon]
MTRTDSIFPNPNLKSTRDKIISLLLEKKPLTIKEIYNAVKREHAFEGTYQAMHKAVVQAADDGVLKKEGMEYVLNPEWVNGVKEFGAAYLDEKYNLAELAKRDIVNLTFPSMMSMGKFVVNYIFKYPGQHKCPKVMHWRHMWPIITVSEEEYAATKKFISEKGAYALTGFDNLIDRMSIESFKQFGCKVKVSHEFRFDHDVMVGGDYISYIYFGEAVKEWDKLCKQIEKVRAVNPSELYKLTFETNVDVNLVIIKNSAVAEQIRRQTMEHFRGAMK